MTTLHLASQHLSTGPSLSLTPLSSTPDSPTDLLANLSHHRDLFSKLRFSYTEQVTKERFLKAAASDPPELVSASELQLLEAKLAEDKASLKTKKEGVSALLASLDQRSREIASRFLAQEERRGEVGDVARDIEDLEARRDALSAQRPEVHPDPMMRMGLEETREVVAERTQEGEMLGQRIEEVRIELERRKRDVVGMKRELDTVEERKREVVREVVEMKRRRGSGVVEMDEVEAKGRWNRAAEGVLRAVA
ncbi:Hypothetical protein D9617_7g029380 [Elsinoe fawcettii]|nr:Hypothetical protein D9617_7g029380 [Elsinoe fawcettii]